MGHGFISEDPSWQNDPLMQLIGSDVLAGQYVALGHLIGDVTPSLQ